VIACSIVREPKCVEYIVRCSLMEICKLVYYGDIQGHKDGVTYIIMLKTIHTFQLN
jgi:hypothetical protein